MKSGARHLGQIAALSLGEFAGATVDRDGQQPEEQAHTAHTNTIGYRLYRLTSRCPYVERLRAD